MSDKVLLKFPDAAPRMRLCHMKLSPLRRASIVPSPVMMGFTNFDYCGTSAANKSYFLGRVRTHLPQNLTTLQSSQWQEESPRPQEKHVSHKTICIHEFLFFVRLLHI